MTASQIIARARSLADFPNAQFISYQDQLKSVKDSFKDVYEFLIQNDDDYFLNEIVGSLTSAMLSPSQVNGNEWWYPLPADFKSIRYVDYQAQGLWSPVYKFPLNSRGSSPSDLMYRIRDNNLWIVGGLYVGTGTQIRIGYYPVIPTVTLPDADQVFGTSWGNTNISNINSFDFAPSAQTYYTMFYIYNGTSIYAESQTNNTVSVPYGNSIGTATASFLNYYKGSLYFISGGNIWSAVATLSAGQTSGTFTAASITTSGSITSIGVFNNLIYFTDASNIKTATLGGGGVATLLAVTSATYPNYLSQWNDTFYIKGGAVLGITTATLPLSYTVTQLQSDSKNLYALDSTYNLHKLAPTTLTNATFGVGFSDNIIRTDVLTVGPWGSANQRQIGSTPPWSEGWLPVFAKEGQEFFAMSDQVDYSFSYPNDFMTQVLEYQCAVDFKVKQDPDSSTFMQSGILRRLGRREPPCTGLWLTLYQGIKRDDYQPQRIGHRYPQPWGVW